MKFLLLGDCTSLGAEHAAALGRGRLGEVEAPQHGGLRVRVGHVDDDDVLRLALWGEGNRTRLLTTCGNLMVGLQVAWHLNRLT